MARKRKAVALRSPEDIDHPSIEASAETIAELDTAIPQGASTTEAPPAQPPTAPRFDYADEARDIVEGLTETCEFLLGPTWKAEPAETDRLSRAAERVLAKYEIALGGWAPEIGLGLASIAYAMPRMQQANAARRAARDKAKAPKPATLALDQA